MFNRSYQNTNINLKVTRIYRKQQIINTQMQKENNKPQRNQTDTIKHKTPKANPTKIK